MNTQPHSHSHRIIYMPARGCLMAGNGSTTPFRDAARLAAEHGGSPKDWSKVSSGSFTAPDGTVFEIHAARNAITGKLLEPKTIFPGGAP